MIKKQYDQLLETCKQTKAEIEYLNENLADSDFVKRLEIEKTQALIDSIEQEVQSKKQDIHHLDMKNRYEQLTSLYQQTTEEVALLQATLESDTQKTDQNQVTRRQASHHQAKRERLDLSVSVSEDPQHQDQSYESMLEKWHESLNKINELENKQQLTEQPAQAKEMKLAPPMLATLVTPTEKADPVTETIKEETPVIFSPIPDTPKVEIPQAAPMLEVKTVPPPKIMETVEEQAVLPLIPQIPKVETPQAASALEAKVVPPPKMIEKEEEQPVLPPIPQTLAAPTLQEQIKAVKGDKLELKEQQEETGEKLDKGKRILGVTLNVIFYVALIGTILFLPLIGLYSPTGAPRELLRHSILRVETEGMSPILPANTLIVTRRVDPTELQIGDTVTFIRFNETTITHDIYAIYENYQNLGTRGFRLIGSASAEPDNEIHQERNLIGRVILSNYPFGRLMMYIHHHFLLIMIFVISILLTLFLLKRKFAPKRARVHKVRKLSKKERGKEKNLQEESASGK